MDVPEWSRYGYLTPDAPECQRDVWALAALVAGRLGEIFGELAVRSAEPVFTATLEEARDRQLALAADLLEEAGDDARRRRDDDDAVREWDAVVGEVAASGHVPSMLATGHLALGAVALAPLRLLEDLAGPAAAPLVARVVGSDDHRHLASLMHIVQLADRERDQVRRLLRHVNAHTARVWAEWVQTFHTLGVDGESLADAGREATRSAAHELGLKVTAHDLKVFAPA